MIFFFGPLNDRLKEVPGIEEFGPWPRVKEVCSVKPGATLIDSSSFCFSKNRPRKSDRQDTSFILQKPQQAPPPERLP